MNRLIQKFTDKILPIMTKLSENDWVNGLYKAKIVTLPMIFVGSFIAVLDVARLYYPGLPNLVPIREYTSGLISLFMVYLIPYYIMSIKNDSQHKHIAGFTGISVYMILAKPLITDSGYLYEFSHFGTDGMFVAILAGIFTTFIFLKLSGISSTIIGKSKLIQQLPSSLTDGIDSLLPITVSVGLAWFFVIELNFDLYRYIVNMLMPLQGIAQTLFGFVLLTFLPTALYSMGISSWVMQPVINPVVQSAIYSNFMKGTTRIFTNETIMAYINLGGKGATLGLMVLLLTSKSKRLKALGYASALPGVLNISDPLTFGLIIWNPTLMIPMWLNAIILPLITYLFMSFGLAPIPVRPFNLWYLPAGINAVLITRSFASLFLVSINLIVSTMIWYPFFKVVEERMITSHDESKELKTMLDNHGQDPI